jgi:hypothetical protein
MTRKTLRRHEIYELVWAQPMRAAAAAIGLSDVGLKKLCVRHSIPTPPQGHWARAASNRPARPALPKPADNRVIDIVTPDPREPLNVDAIAPDIAPLFAAEREAPPIETAEGTERLHPVVDRMRRSLLSAAVDKYGAVQCHGGQVFSIRVPPASVDRAVAIADAVIRASVARGFKVEPAKDRETAACLVVGGERIVFSMEEPSRRKVHLLTDEERQRRRTNSWMLVPAYDFFPSGEMSIKIGAWPAPERKWRDTETRRLETRLNDVLVGMLEIAVTARTRRLRGKEEEVRRLAAEAEREEHRRQAEAEKTRAEHLEAAAARWHRARQVRLYVDAVEIAAAPEDAEKAEWIAWARAHADRLDPLK